MSNVFLIYSACLLALVVAAAAILVVPQDRPRVRAWHWVLLCLAMALLLLPTVFFVSILDTNPKDLSQPELGIPALLTIAMLMLIGLRFARLIWRKESSA